MRIKTLAIDGYGKFVGRTIDLSPGVQVIIGPNEQGKSTLRAFIGDMLYGQKHHADQRRLYEESNELRCPWGSPESYGGRLIYQLDDGREIEVFRRFDKENEAVQVCERTNGRDITRDLPQARNHEPLFALDHLGLSREVFLNAATISHVSLEDLGDADALAQMREKLLSLADSGEGATSAEAALKRLEARIAAIGQPAARTRPLPAVRARLAALSREHHEAAALRRDLAAIDERRRACSEETTRLHEKRAAFEEELDTIEKAARAERLREAEVVRARIDDATQRSFALGAAREFPLAQVHEFQRCETLVATAEAQLERTRADRAKLEQQLDQERQALGEAAAFAVQEIPGDREKRIMDLDAAIQGIRTRIEEAGSARAAAQVRLEQAQEELAALPEFNRVAADPVTWLTQIGSSFQVAQRCRQDECQKAQTLAEKIARQAAVVEEPKRVFAACNDFPAKARDYEVRTRVSEEQLAQLTAAAESLQVGVKENAERVPGFRWLSLLTAGVVIVLLVIQHFSNNSGLFVAAGLAAVVALCLLLCMVQARSTAARAAEKLKETEASIAEVKARAAAPDDDIECMMQEAGCETIRELEARYDRYREACVELASLQEAQKTQDVTAEEATQRVAQLLEHFRETFRKLGQEVAEEADVAEAVSMAIQRYQEYRDAKRRVYDGRDQLKRHESELARLRERLDASLREERDAAAELRRWMRENGFEDESRHDTIVAALRAYRNWSAHHRGKQAGIEFLDNEIAGLGQRLDAEEKDLERHASALARYLAAAGVETPEEWHQHAQQAKEYHELREKRTALEEQLAALLRAQDIEALRAEVEADGPLPEAPPRSEVEVKRDLEALDARIDALTKEEHALHIALTERSAGVRALNEIEEERAFVEGRVRALELELNAASHAMAHIEEIARDRHARIAPRLASLASNFLAQITDDAYHELLVGRDLSIRVRVPETQRMVDGPENVLSKGTVDQLYLALRLAMVQALSESGESIPMLLDDPFANYDDHRLEHTMRLLARLAERNQILVFTCRDDVARAARAANAPILEL